MSLKGTVKILLESPTVKYELSFNRNISLIRGSSGSGKSYLCELIEQFQMGLEGLHLDCINCEQCIVMPAVTLNSTTTLPWYDIIKNATDTLFFIDEFCDCLHSGNFSGRIKHTPNYYVIISREAHSELPYSVHSIYTLSVDDHLSTMEQKVIINTRYVDNLNLPKINPQCLLVEDTGTGTELFKNLLNLPAISAGSKTRVYKKLVNLLQKDKNNILVIVDSAAFGPHWEQVYKLICSSAVHIGVYLPESTEWLLLHSLCFKDIEGIQNLLNNFLSLINYEKFFSTEPFFTSILENYCIQIGQGPYDKGESLSTCFLEKTNLSHLLKMLPVEPVNSNLATHTTLFREYRC